MSSFASLFICVQAGSQMQQISYGLVEMDKRRKKANAETLSGIEGGRDEMVEMKGSIKMRVIQPEEGDVRPRKYQS